MNLIAIPVIHTIMVTFIVCDTRPYLKAEKEDEINGDGANTDDSYVRPAYRLPADVVPIKYTLKVATHLENFDYSFAGTVFIKIHVLNCTNRITLHSKRLNISEKAVELYSLKKKDKKGPLIKIVDHQFDEEYDFYTITVEQILTADSYYKLCIPFSGVLYEDLTGYYRSSYVDQATGKTKWMAVTQFEPIDARRAFPCFDEPAMKAVFSICIGHTKKYKAVSNMPLMKIASVRGQRGWMYETFEDTKPMSTYLVAYMVSQLEHRVSNLNYSPGIVCRVWARKDVIEQVEFAREVAPKVLTFFEKYFDTEYPLPKQDMVAVPDFNSGAMENWGLITFRERALLYDSNQSSIMDKHTVISVLSHEFAHQWFGNLVTMKWWTDLWLNEGFATHVGNLGVDYMFPQWKTLDSETVDNLLLIFAADSLNSSHPVSVPIGNPTEIDQIFDVVSYRKGCFLLHMMYHFLTEEVFRRGVKTYLRNHRYGNAVQNDLWGTMTEAAHAKSVLSRMDTVKMIMDTWTLDAGYPLLTVRRQYTNETATVVQERYVSSKFRMTKEKLIKSCWIVPLTFTSATESDFTNTKPKEWLPCGGPSMITRIAPREDWVIFNIKATALYRVNYDDENWRMITHTLTNEEQFKKIPALNRVLLISDMLAIAWINRITYRQVFNAFNYLKFENEYLPLKAAYHGLGHLNSMLIRSSIYSEYKQYVKALIEPNYEFVRGNLSKLPVDYERIKQHCLIVKNACYYGVEDCRTQTGDLFNRWYSNPTTKFNPIPSNLRRDVYCNALRYADEEHWTFLWNKYNQCNVVSEKDIILEALTCSENETILNRYLNWSLDETKIRKQDSLIVFYHVASNEIGYPVAKKFLMEKFDQINSLHAQKPSNLGYYVKVIAKQIISEEDLNEFEKFINSKSDQLKYAYMAVQQGIETANNNIAWHLVQFKKIALYFSNGKPDDET